MRRLVATVLVLLGACASAQHPADPGPDIETVNEPGQIVDISRIPVTGKVTIVDFYADWCEPCRDLESRILAVARVEPNLAVRKIDIVDHDSPVARAYNIGIIPHVRVYDTTGEMRYLLIGRNAKNAPRIATELIDEARTEPGAAAKPR